MGPEIAVRMATMRTRAKDLSSPILRKEAVPLRKRACVLNAVILAHGLFQSGTWPDLYAAELGRIHTSV